MQNSPDMPDVPATFSLTLEQYEQLNPICLVPFGQSEVFYCTPNQSTKWRVDTLFAKEPDTIDWIAEFAPEDVLVDVGANVGMYTIWAAKTRGVRVFAFEPESQNYALLNKNIVVNQLSDRAIAYCAALSNTTTFDLLHLSDFSVGQSCHTFGEKVDFRLQPANYRLAQGCFSTTLDALVETGTLPIPQHIKIDVDGLEHKVIEGAGKTLGHHRVRSVLVEINQNIAEHREVVKFLEGLGFTYQQSQVERSLRREGAFMGVGNYVFRR